jgi:hypothetical protein
LAISKQAFHGGPATAIERNTTSLDEDGHGDLRGANFRRSDILANTARFRRGRLDISGGHIDVSPNILQKTALCLICANARQILQAA